MADEVRLIDANALILKIQEDIDLEPTDGETDSKEQFIAEQLIALGLKIALKDVKKAPTVEAKPVKHGRWERRAKDIYACTECTNEVSYRQRHSFELCPYCGARMDGKSK